MTAEAIQFIREQHSVSIAQRQFDSYHSAQPDNSNRVT
jgi:hypothetical protein